MELPENTKENESLITNKVQISNKINEYYVNVVPNLANKIKENNVNFKKILGERSVHSIFLDAVTEKEVELKIGALDKSCGHDKISPKLTKEISKYIIKPLTYIYNQSLHCAKSQIFGPEFVRIRSGRRGVYRSVPTYSITHDSKYTWNILFESSLFFRIQFHTPERLKVFENSYVGLFVR